MTAEEILNFKGAIQTQNGLLYERNQCLEAMEEYAQQQCQKRDELIKAYQELDECLSMQCNNVNEITEKHTLHFRLRRKIEQLKSEIK